MKKELIQGRNGYDIPCINNLTGHEKLVVIISHGFGSSKESPTAQAVSATLSKHGIETVRFDFPAHGDSPVDGGMLRIANCLDDLAAVEAHVHKLNPEADIAYFSSSFGAYLNLIYLATREHAGRRSFLRCAAVDMPGIVRRGMTPEHCAELDAQGFVILDEGYVRSLKITREFLSDLDAHDVCKLCRPGMAELAMIHGADDETAPIEDARRFAKLSGAALTEVEGADHRFLIPGGMDRVLDAAVSFFTVQPESWIQIRKLMQPEIAVALRLVRDVFMKFEAPDYSQEGVRNFMRAVDDEQFIGGLDLYGAFAVEKLVGVAATRNKGDHIALFFVDGRYHRRGIGRKLFETVLQNSASDRITLHSSPFAVEVYRRLGFAATGSERVEDGIRYIPMAYAKGG